MWTVWTAVSIALLGLFKCLDLPAIFGDFWWLTLGWRRDPCCRIVKFPQGPFHLQASNAKSSTAVQLFGGFCTIRFSSILQICHQPCLSGLIGHQKFQHVVSVRDLQGVRSTPDVKALRSESKSIQKELHPHFTPQSRKEALRSLAGQAGNMSIQELEVSKGGMPKESAADSPRGVEGWQVTLDQHGYYSIHVDTLVDDFGVNG